MQDLHVPGNRKYKGSRLFLYRDNRSQQRVFRGRMQCVSKGRCSVKAEDETFTVDTVPPTLQIMAPSNGLITNKKTVTVSGKTDDVSSKPVTVTVNGATVTVGTDGTFTKDVTLAEGANTITIVAKDKAGKTTTVTRKVTVDTSAPVIKSVTLTPNPVDCGKTFIIAVEITD